MRIAIIGGGATGVLAALALLQAGRGGDQVVLYEPGVVGTGLAYRVPDETLLLNVRAYNMSAYADQPGHFVEWLAATQRSADPEAFVPRSWYAAYLGDTLAAARAASVVAYRQVAAAVVAVDGVGASAVVTTAAGDREEYDRVVLATGYQQPTNPLARWLPTRERVVSGYDWRAVAAIPAQAAVLIVGMGLTMVDSVATLQAAGHQGAVTIWSRHGLQPRVHAPRAGYPAPLTAADAPLPLSGQLRRVRAAIATAAAEGTPWQAVIDSLRPHTQALWMGYDASQKARFLRHLRARWDVHRHRIAPAMATVLARAQATGRYRFLNGRASHAAATAQGIQVGVTTPAGQTTVDAEWVIVCTGPESDLDLSQNPLVVQLRRDGMLRTDPLHLGVDTAPNGQIVDRQGEPLPWLWALGPLRKGMLWECIAVPDIRTEAAQLAGNLLAGGAK